MSNIYEVVWPSGKSTIAGQKLAKRLDSLQGKTVAELWSWTFKGDIMFKAFEDELGKRYPDIKFISWKEFGEIHGANEREVLAALPEKLKNFGVDAVICGVGGGASGAAADVRCSVLVEKLGIPTVTIVTDAFLGQGGMTAKGLGYPNLPFTAHPGQPLVCTDEQVYANTVNILCDEVVTGLTVQPADGEDIKEPDRRDIIFSGTNEEVNEYFYEHEWQDGLPIVPPTIEKVEEFLKYTDRAEEEVLGVIQPDNREVTVWSVAVNGVMSGCLPEYMPILIAIVEGILDPVFQHEHLGHTPGMEELIIINGKGIIKELGFNCTQGVMRPGPRANTSIGRFWRMFLRNMATFLPHKADKSCFGDGFRVVLAENEEFLESIGWEPMSVDAGFEAGDNIVTICSCTEKTQVIQAGADTAEKTLENIEKRMGDDNLFVEYHFRGMETRPVIVIPPQLINKLIAGGYDKAKIKEHFHENAKKRLSHMGTATLQRFYEAIDQKIWPNLIGTTKDLDRDVKLTYSSESFRIVVSGDVGGSHVLICTQQGIIGWPVSKKIELPKNWAELPKKGN